MWILLIALILLGTVAAIAGTLRSRHGRLQEGETDGVPEVKRADGECCGRHEVCERDSLLAAVSRRIVYYDDEELDRFAGRSGDDYCPEEEEAFREVFYTMQDEDVAGWLRSLQLRGITLPDGLRDEVFLVVGERRVRNSNKQTV